MLNGVARSLDLSNSSGHFVGARLAFPIDTHESPVLRIAGLGLCDDAQPAAALVRQQRFARPGRFGWRDCDSRTRLRPADLTFC
jgi:hypothetical protein